MKRFANLRLLLGFLYMHPGKKLLFMGGEIGQWNEWNHETSLDWHLLANPNHDGIKRWVTDLNGLYRETSSLFEQDFTQGGFEWIDCTDVENSVIAFIRRGINQDDTAVIVGNFTPLPRHNYRVGVPRPGRWKESLNSDAAIYGGSGQGNLGGSDSAPVPFHGRYHSISLTVPPLSLLVFTPQE